MKIKRLAAFLVVLGVVPVLAERTFAQAEPNKPTSTTAQQPASNQQEEEKLKLQNRALALLEEVLSEAQALKLPENRARVQIAVGDVLWARDQPRARDLFSNAGALISLMSLQSRSRDETETARLRRELVLIAAQHDVDLAFQLLGSTRPPDKEGKTLNDNSSALETSLIQTLLSIIAATDPKAAYQRAVESLDKNEYPAKVGTVLRRLHSNDREAFEKLSKKLLSKLTPDNLVDSEEAGDLALALLRSGPILDTSTLKSTANPLAANSTEENQALDETSYQALMDAAISAALTSVPDIRPPTRDAVTFMGLDAPPGTPDAVWVKGPDGRTGFSLLQPATQPGNEQTRRSNIESLLMGLQRLLPRIDQYFPLRGQTVRQKLTELGIGNSQTISVDQGTSESLMLAAKLAPSEVQSQIYQEAAQKAIDEGNMDRALQIANDHLEGPGQEAITRAVELKRTPDATKLKKAREMLATLLSDSARVRALISEAIASEKENPELAVAFLKIARNIASKKASNYEDFENQLKVANAFATLDIKSSFEMLELGIPQLNEILAAAAIVNGFEAEVFRDGELPFQGGSELGNMVARYGSELASLSRIDFARARIAADKFQLAESRLLAKLLIVQHVLGDKPCKLPRGCGLSVKARY